MNTPIYDFAKAYSESSPLRLHMPGHKGVSRLGCEGLDITEFDGADSLYHADGIILESENNATELFGSAHTFYSAEGSSLSIRTMLYLIKRHAEDNNKQVKILAARNAHKTFITGCALLGIDVQWIFPDSHGSYLSCRISAEELEKRLTREYFTAVYITSPDYLGNIADVEAIGKVCDKHGALLAVDNAHGAYLKFLTPSRHPLDLGAHLCCDSAHKTLPVLTGGAYLHVSKKAPESFLSEARDALSLFGSTSPSYLILQSLDLANKYISEGYAEKLIHTAERLKKLKSALSSMGFELMGDEVLKLTVKPKSFGYTGEELAKVLLERGAVCEFYDPDATVMMFTPDTSDGDIDRLCGIFAGIEKRVPVTSRPPEMKPPRAILSPSEVLFADREALPVCECAGRLLASASVSCPPAVPIVSCGEEITEDAIKMFEYYGIKSCTVVKKQIHGEQNA